MVVLREFGDLKATTAMLRAGHPVCIVDRTPDADHQRMMDFLAGWALGSGGNLVCSPDQAKVGLGGNGRPGGAGGSRPPRQLPVPGPVARIGGGRHSETPGPVATHTISCLPAANCAGCRPSPPREKRSITRV